MATRRPRPARWRGYASRFDSLFSSLAQRRGFRDYLQDLLLPRDRNKTLTGLGGAELIAGAQHREVQRLQWFLSESAWDHEQVNEQRLQLLCEDPATTPHAAGALVIDDTGDRKDGTATAHVARQYLGSVGKIDDGIVAVNQPVGRRALSSCKHLKMAVDRVIFPPAVPCRPGLPVCVPRHHYCRARVNRRSCHRGRRGGGASPRTVAQEVLGFAVGDSETPRSGLASCAS